MSDDVLTQFDKPCQVYIDILILIHLSSIISIIMSLIIHQQTIQYTKYAVICRYDDKTSTNIYQGYK